MALVALSIAGCGSAKRRAGPSAAEVCTQRARAAVANFLRVQARTVAAARSTGNDGAPQCTFTTHVTPGGKVQVIANVDVEPSAYFILERTIVEASQIFGGQRFIPAPVAVPSLGLEASWFPDYDWLEATDGTRIVTTSVDWNGVKQGQEIALARAVTQLYLKTPHGKAAERVVQGYPSG